MPIHNPILPRIENDTVLETAQQLRAFILRA
jgi:hypothetical protein